MMNFIFFPLRSAAPTLKFQSSSPLKTQSKRTVHLQCDFFGIPKPEIDWKFIRNRNASQSRAVTLNHHQNLLTLTQVTQAEQGLYECEAHNAFGRTSGRIELQIIRK